MDLTPRTRSFHSANFRPPQTEMLPPPRRSEWPPGGRRLDPSPWHRPDTLSPVTCPSAGSARPSARLSVRLTRLPARPTFKKKKKPKVTTSLRGPGPRRSQPPPANEKAPRRGSRVSSRGHTARQAATAFVTFFLRARRLAADTKPIFRPQGVSVKSSIVPPAHHRRRFLTARSERLSRSQWAEPRADTLTTRFPARSCTGALRRDKR